MAWSTQQLADLAGSTVKAVRYYHRIGLLPEPERTANGYKQYDTTHLVRLLQIRRLSEIGFSLDQVEELAAPGSAPLDVVRRLDADLADEISRLTEIRAELAALLEHRAPVYVPKGFASIGRRLNDVQRSLLLVYAAVLSPEAMAEFSGMIAEPSETEPDFQALAPDAPEEEIESIARRMVSVVRRQYAEHPNFDAGLDVIAPRWGRVAGETMAQAMADLQNPAQNAVMKRLAELLAQPDSSA